MKFAPTFSYTNYTSFDYVCMTIFNDNGTIHDYIYVDNHYDYCIMFFQLIEKHRNPCKVLTVWNKWWNNGTLDGLKYDLQHVINIKN